MEIWDLYNLNFEVIGEHVRGTEMPEDGRKVLTQIRDSAGGTRVNDINDVYLFSYDGPIRLAEASTDEVAQARWMARDEIVELYRQGKMVSVIKDLSYFIENTDGVFA